METPVYTIPVFLASSRKGRKSDRVAKFVLAKLSGLPGIATEIIDLEQLNLPVMEERLRLDPDAPEGARILSQKLFAADAVVVVAPEYNWGIAGSTKNAFDYLGAELKRKPIGLVAVSNGAMGGMQLTVQFRSLAAAMGAILVPSLFPVTKVEENFDESGNTKDPMIHKRADSFLNELMWMTSAITMKRELEKTA